MYATKEHTSKNPRDGANIFSILFFTYTYDIFKKGYGKTLYADDLYNPISSDRSKILGDRLEGKWMDHLESSKKKNKTPSLLRVLIATFWPEYLYLGFLLSFMDIFLKLTQPIMLGYLLDYFQPNSDMTKTDALWYAAIVVILSGCVVLINNQFLMGGFHYGMKVRAACCALIYRKALRLSKTALGDIASGKVVNLISSDVSRFELVSIVIHHMWVAPTSAIIVLCILYVKSGYAGVLGIIPFLVIVPLQSYTGKLSAIYRKQTALKTDERIRLMDEIVSGVQVIKMYAWEKPFSKLIQLARRNELKIVTKSSYIRGLYMAFNLFTTRISLFCTLITMALTDQPITPGKIFVFVAFFNIISQTMSSMFVRGIAELSEAFVSIKRLQEFMLNEECKKIESGIPKNNAKDNTIIKMRNATVKWNNNATEIALNKFNITIERGKLLVIIGPVGSGKSTLLQTLLGELNLSDGEIFVNGSLSYASQEPWIFGATLRQNIVFGNEFNKKRYSEVVHACALEKDFKQFADGDLAIVGDRGSSLSGGQKARINLARAVYRDADIYLLDDPLSAVDVHVSKHLYEKCINGYLKNKTRILVTHQVHHLKDAGHILILKNGSIEEEGSYLSLSQSDNLYAKLLTSEPDKEDDEKLRELQKLARRTSIRSRQSSISSAVSELSLADSMSTEEFHDDGVEEKKHKDLQEESSKGKVQGSLLWRYLRTGGNICYVFTVIVLFLLAQTAASGVDYFVNFWVNIEEMRNKTLRNYESTDVFVEPSETWPKELCIYVYTSLIVTLFIIAFVRSMVFYNLAMSSSQNLHDSIFSNVISATMRFFDTTPSGRILNRFSKDICSIDEFLPKYLLDSGQILLLMVGTFVLVTIINPFFIILVIVISIFFLIMRHIFLKSSKNIKRLEGIMRSPVFTHLNTTLQGLTTIRAFGAESILKGEFDKHQDYHTSAWFMYIAATSAFGFYLDILCYIFIAVVTFSFLTFGEDFGLTGGKVGLAITQSMTLTTFVQWGIRQSAEAANQLMSVERIVEYNVLPRENQPAIPKKPSPTWPEKGSIIFKNMGLRYDNLGPLILKSLNIVINPQEKIGIVGRTGAGKSSLISALFRLAIVEGEIKIDDIDTKDINLQDLRSRISIIPQDPVLFSGTLRYNLDPFEEYSDDLLYRAINEVELKDPENIINRLENRVMDRGSNYSVGQRQLICLARAIVRNNKILMLDEATANVDPQTDALIQKTIRKKFADCTVLTVAHRLNTIMDSDKVLVMESGTLVEFDHPHSLLQNQNSVFFKMVAETGKNVGEQLRKIAFTSYKRQKSVPE